MCTLYACRQLSFHMNGFLIRMFPFDGKALTQLHRLGTMKTNNTGTIIKTLELTFEDTYFYLNPSLD